MQSALTIKDALQWAKQQLISAAHEMPSSESAAADDAAADAAVDARFLLCHLLNKSLSYLLTWPDEPLSSEQYWQFHRYIARRKAGEPVAYIVGYREFWSLKLAVSPDTLIPRSDTEILIEQALPRLLHTDAKILDLGSGTGAIALALASELPDSQVIGIDKVEAAVKLAQHNAKKNQITNARFICGDWFQPVKGQRFDLIVSNPPYICSDDPHLLRGDLRYEPSSALVSDQQGLADITWLIANGKTHLNRSGWLLIEHGFEQGEQLRALFKAQGYSKIETIQDYGNNERVTLGCCL